MKKRGFFFIMAVCLLFSTFLINASVDNEYRGVPETINVEELIDLNETEILIAFDTINVINNFTEEIKQNNEEQEITKSIKSKSNKVKKIYGFDLEIPLTEFSPKVISEIFTSTVRSISEPKRIIVTLKEPSEIISWKNQVSQMPTGDVKRLKTSMREYAIQNDVKQNNVKHRYSSFNGFSVTVTDEELDYLMNDPLVAMIENDDVVHTFLQDSVPLINATNIWTNKVSGVNLTGQGQTVCIIDTGVDYTHADFGNCSPSSSGNRTIGSYSLSSPNYPSEYPNDYDNVWSITKSGYDRVSVFFTEIDVEEDWDYVCILDGDDNYVGCYTGFYSNFWSPSVEGSTIKIELYTDGTNDGGPYRGFNINSTKNATTYSTLDWSSCAKITAGHDFVNSDSDPIDDEGHGTHVAGIVAANGLMKGVAPDAKIVAVKSLNSAGGGWISDIIAGMEYCIANAASKNISVISMSLGGSTGYSTYCDGTNPSYAVAINAAASVGISVVVATGNDGNITGISSPSCIQNAIPISSTTKANKFSSFSNRNSLVQLLAPGGTNGGTGNCSAVSSDLNRICSLNDGGGYISMSGTSMATPHVAGAFAIMYQYLDLQNLTRTPAQLESIFNSTGVRIVDTGYSNLTFSRIDLYEAIMSLEIPPSVIIDSPNNDALILANPVIINVTVTDDGDNVLLCSLYDNDVVISTFNASSGVLVSFGVNFSDGNHTWYINCSDDGGNSNTSEIRVFTIVDTTAPKYINRVMSPAEYSADGTYSFNVTWIEAVGIDNVTFNFNGINYNMSSLGGGSYYRTSSQTPTFTIATETIYTYYFWANDTSGYSNETDVLNFSVIFPTASQTIANTELITVGENITQIIVPTNTVLRNVIVTSTNSVAMNLSNIVFGGSVIIPNNFTLIRGGTVNYTAFIPSGTIITGATGWDNTIILPLVKSNSGYTAPSGDVDVVVDVGSGVELNFSQPVKIIIGDMEGKSAAWTRGAGTLTEITRECNDVDVPTNIDSVTNRECYIDSGDDLVIWTYHFTEFAAYTPEVITPRTPGGGGGGGGGGSTIEAINFTGNTGYVLDAGTGKKFSFFVGTSLKYIKIMIIQNPYVSFTVQDPVAVFTLSAGGITEVDFDGDGEVDIEVHLVSINENGKVNFKVVINDGSDKLKPFTTSVLPPTTNAVKEQKVVNNTPPVQTINDDSENSKSLARVILKFLAISIAIAALVVMIIIVMITVYTKSKF